MKPEYKAWIDLAGFVTIERDGVAILTVKDTVKDTELEDFCEALVPVFNHVKTTKQLAGE